MKEQVILETISKHIQIKRVTRSSQYGSMEEKSCLTNLMGFYDQMTGLMDVFYFDFMQAFNIFSNNILIDRQMKHRLDKWRKWQTGISRSSTN